MSRHLIIYPSLVALIMVMAFCFAPAKPSTDEFAASINDLVTVIADEPLHETAAEPTKPVALVTFQAETTQEAGVPVPAPETNAAAEGSHDHGDVVLGCCCETVCELRCVRFGLFKLRKRLCYVPVVNCAPCPIHSPSDDHGESIMAPEPHTEELPAPVADKAPEA